MTHALYARNSVFMRLVSAFVALTFTMSIAGTGIAAPQVRQQGSSSDPAVVSEEPVTPEVPAPADKPSEPDKTKPSDPAPDPSVEAAPTTTEPGTGKARDGAVAADPSEGPSDASANVAPVASAAPAVSAQAVPDYAVSNLVDWQAYRLGPQSQVGWSKSQLADYVEGDWVPVRIFVKAPADTDLRFPGFGVQADFLMSSQDAIGADRARGFKYFTAASLPGGSAAPGGATDISPLFSQGVTAGDSRYGITMATPSTDLVIPAGQYGVVYFQVHLSITPYWNAKNPAHDGSGFMPGGSTSMRFVSWNGGSVGDNTISLKVLRDGGGSLCVRKWNDLNRNNRIDNTEPYLAGWEMVLSYTEPGFEFTLKGTTVMSSGVAAAHFAGLPPGSYEITETSQPGWTNSTPLPLTYTLGRSEVGVVFRVGNYQPDVTKTWNLSIDSIPLGGTPFVTYSVNGGATSRTELTGSGPSTAAVPVPGGATISDIKWYMHYGDEDVLLGTSDNETLTGDKTNRFSYDSSVAGRKFDAADGEGLSGWTVVLKRIVASTESTYAQTITGPGGTYAFEDVIPGTYAVYEVQQGGWLNTVAPSGTFVVSNGAHIADKDFGNLNIKSSIDIDKTGPAMAHVGDLVSYTIVVTNTGNYTLTNVTVSDPLLGMNINIGSLAPQATYTLTPSRTVLASDPDPLPNNATVIGTTVFGGPVADSDDHSVDILKPAITVAKSADPTISTAPASVVYTYIVTNSGPDALHDVILSDDKLAVPGGNIGALAPQQSVTLTAAATLTQSTTNKATVSGKDALDLSVSATDSASVDVFNPSISIVKSASSNIVLPGEMVTYTYLVTNTGDIALFDIGVSDNVLGPVGTIATLAPLASATLTFAIPVGADVTNIGTATGWYGTAETGFYGSVSASEPETVDVVHPAVEVVKTGAPNPVVTGSTVTYSYEVFNRGDVALYDLEVTDDLLGAIGTVPVLPVAASATLTKTAALAVTTTNLATVLGHDQYLHPVTDTDTETVDVYDPRISIVKTADRTRVVAGDSVTYSYLVTNEGDITLHDIVVTDDVLGAVGTISSLAAHASATLTKTTTVSADVTNVGTATGWYGQSESPFYGSVTSTDPATVDAIHPAVEILKSASPSPVVSGGQVTYTFVVHNTGDSTLFGLDVTDDHLGFIGSVAELAADASATLTMTTVLTQTTTNVATVEGHDEFENSVSATDTATVPVYHPSIAIAKSASANTVLAGDSVTYTYLVTNTGDIALHDIAVTDDVLGTIGTIAVLNVGLSDTVTFTTTVSADVTNIGTATGWYGLAETAFFGSVQASEPESVDVIHPTIGVAKSAAPAAIVLGESVTYTYVVSNPGDVDLFGITLTDDKLGVVGTLDTLPVGGTHTFTMDATPSEPTTNVVTAVGVDALEHSVSATDSAFVDVALPFTPKPPDVAIDKSADKTTVSAGDTVTYTLTYRNVGEADAFDMVITDDFDERYVTVIDDGGGTVADGKIVWDIAGPLSPADGARTITYKVRIDSTLPASVTRIDNTVVVNAPDDNNPDNDTDTWRVTLGSEPFLPFTGAEVGLILLAALMAAATGALLRRAGRSTA